MADKIQEHFNFSQECKIDVLKFAERAANESVSDADIQSLITKIICLCDMVSELCKNFEEVTHDQKIIMQRIKKIRSGSEKVQHYEH